MGSGTFLRMMKRFLQFGSWFAQVPPVRAFNAKGTQIMTSTQFPLFLVRRVYLVVASILIATSAVAAHAQAPPNAVAAFGLAEGERHLVTRVEPVYPELAKKAQIEGTVALMVTVSEQGTVEKAVLLSGHPMLVAAALDAVKQWKYTPFLRNREPVEAHVSVEIVFSLPLSPEERLEKRSQADLSKQMSKSEQDLETHLYAAEELSCRAAIDLAEKWPQPGPLMGAYRREGDALFYQNKFSQSLGYYRQELALAEKEADSFYRNQEEPQAHYDLARALQGAGDLKEAQTQYETAIDILERARNGSEVTGFSPFLKVVYEKALQPLLHDYASLLRRSGNSAAADATERKANSVATELAEEQKAVDEYTPQEERCNKLFQKAEYAEAVEACKTAVELSEKLPPDHWPERMTAYRLEAETLLRQKKAAESVGYFQKALAQAERYVPWSPGEAGALHDVARALVATGDLQQARSYYRRAIDAYTQACDKMHGPLEQFKPMCTHELQSVLLEYAALSRQAGDPSAASEAEQRAKSVSGKDDARKQ